ncbi:hypothetical protein B296_00031838 [Ensete ventricosum]|uniref:Uncharacterized protein n=1 Tax=Ensete ventricosum TaxID=4639 RepID=A0A426YSH8_ENSVE|nr:hypothetical protein B296_00031838 [Ensete ventricosum]
MRARSPAPLSLPFRPSRPHLPPSPAAVASSLAAAPTPSPTVSTAVGSSSSSCGGSWRYFLDTPPPLCCPAGDRSLCDAIDDARSLLPSRATLSQAVPSSPSSPAAAWPPSSKSPLTSRVSREPSSATFSAVASQTSVALSQTSLFPLPPVGLPSCRTWKPRPNSSPTPTSAASFSPPVLLRQLGSGNPPPLSIDASPASADQGRRAEPKKDCRLLPLCRRGRCHLLDRSSKTTVTFSDSDQSPVVGIISHILLPSLLVSDVTASAHRSPTASITAIYSSCAELDNI